MDKKDILEIFLKNGVLVPPREFEKINEKNYMQVLEKMLGGAKKDEIFVAEPKRGKITCDEFIRFCNSRFEFLRGVLLKKTNAVSINKGRKVFSEVTIIGRVKETNSRGFVIEDVTGEAEVISENKDIGVGDVLGLKGFFKENHFLPNQIIWPDIPLENSPKPVGFRITLTTKIKENMAGLIICPGVVKSENVVSGFGRLGIIKISKHGREIDVIAYTPDKETGEENAVRILKKRYIREEGTIDNMIAEIPGIFWLLRNGKNWSKNYRGVVIISTDANSFAEYEGGEVAFGPI